MYDAGNRASVGGDAGQRSQVGFKPTTSQPQRRPTLWPNQTGPVSTYTQLCGALWIRYARHLFFLDVSASVDQFSLCRSSCNRRLGTDKTDLVDFKIKYMVTMPNRISHHYNNQPSVFSCRCSFLLAFHVFHGETL